jgi:hypothetical protein
LTSTTWLRRAERISAEAVLPEFDHRERHAVRVDASAERALAAVREVTPGEAPLLRVLFRLRGLKVASARPVWEQMRERGFRKVEPNTLFAVGRPWRLLEGLAFEGDEREGSSARMAMDFRAEDGVLSTETRVVLTDARARRRFRAYWLVVRPFSGLVRRSWLRAAKRRAEAGA